VLNLIGKDKTEDKIGHLKVMIGNADHTDLTAVLFKHLVYITYLIIVGNEQTVTQFAYHT
jgi:hypothetical protein